MTTDDTFLSLSPAEQRGAHRFPGVVTLTQGAYRRLIEDEHTLFSGERARLHALFHKLDHRKELLEGVGHSPEKIRKILHQVLHDSFVGDIEDASCETVRMFRGTPGDFDLDRDRWRKACENVIETYRYVLLALPRELKVPLHGETITVNLASRLAYEEHLLTDDPIELFEIVRHAKPRSRAWHFARAKLEIALYVFGAIRHGYSPEELERTRTTIDAFLGRRFFLGSTGRPVTIIAELDPSDGYRCVRWDCLRDHVPPVMQECRRSIHAQEFSVQLQNGTRLKILYSSRSKRRLFLKALTKENASRFIQINGLGDGVGLKFVVEPENLDEFVRAVRPVLVPCSGSVAEQNSTVGHRNGKSLDANNRHTSKSHELMKYNALVGGGVIEVQFMPMKAWINEKCAHNDDNHWRYKMRQLLDDILPLLFPERLFGIPWSDPLVREQCLDHAITLEHE